MLKKYLKLIVIFIALFSFISYDVNAYEFVEPSNESLVNQMIVEIYDTKEQYEELAGDYVEVSKTIFNANNSSYWLPIGSEVTTETDGKVFAKDTPVNTYMTSSYGYRIDPLGRGTKFHSGVDFACGLGSGVVNIVAAKDGIVVYPTASSPKNCKDGTGLDSCGGGYGNYVIIQHSDGNYTLYAHLSYNSVTVTAGDSVEQGQVIGKMGSSGYSTGPHLHFEVREGQVDKSATVDPMGYVSLENPRILTTSSGVLALIQKWEGHSPIEGEYYIVEDIGDGVRSVGGGITLENNPERFARYGLDIADYPIGSKIPITIIDQMQMEVINDKKSYLESVLAKNQITLEQNQIDALVSMMYNTGNINGFVDNYKKYGNTQEFYENWFFRNVMKGTKFEKGLTRRRNAEWALFHLGDYDYNG